jgi:hypothetical protein
MLGGGLGWRGFCPLFRLHAEVEGIPTPILYRKNLDDRSDIS